MDNETRTAFNLLQLKRGDMVRWPENQFGGEGCHLLGRIVEIHNMPASYIAGYAVIRGLKSGCFYQVALSVPIELVLGVRDD